MCSKRFVSCPSALAQHVDPHNGRHLVQYKNHVDNRRKLVCTDTAQLQPIPLQHKHSSEREGEGEEDKTWRWTLDSPGWQEQRQAGD